MCHVHELNVGIEDLFEINIKKKHRKCFHNPAQGSKWQKKYKTLRNVYLCRQGEC